MRISRGALLGLATFASACASGGETGPEDAATVRLDAPRDGAPQDTQQLQDGPVDTMPPQDMQSVPDGAPPGSNLFCGSNPECTIAGECCFDFAGASEVGVCVTGTIFLTACIPD